MADPAVEIANVLKGASELLERVALEPHCLRCLELEQQLLGVLDENAELERIIDEIADMEEVSAIE